MKNDIKLALMTGVDIPIPECQLTLHQPTLKEISYLGETTFFTGLQILTINKKKLINTNENLELLPITDFEIFTKFCEEDKEKKQFVKDVLDMLFSKYKILMTPRSICFMQDNSISIVLDENNFNDFQEYLNKVFCLDKGEQNGFNPKGNKAQEIAKKLQRARERVAAQKQVEDKHTLDSYISSLVIAIPSMSLQNVINLTLYQLYDLLERYSLYIGWDLDIRCQLAGGGSKDGKHENWMKSIH